MIEPQHHDGISDEAASVTVYLDDDQEPLATFRPPATAHIDTSTLADGEHVLHLHAVDASGVVGVRTIPFAVRNGPYISVSGLRAGETVGGTLDLRINAFSSGETFDPVQAESRRPVPNAVWIALSVFLVWATWWGLGNFFGPPAYANASGAPDVIAQAGAAAKPGDAAAPTARNIGGFDYGATGGTVYTNNCAGCHGAEGAGVPGAFPPLAGDPVVNAADPTEQIHTVLHGLHGKAIGGKAYASQMPPYAQLSDEDIASAIDHERTSWGNHGPVITPAQVKALR